MARKSSVPKIRVFGKASGQLYREISINNEHQNLSVLSFLESENIPIASSCSGKGYCLKCVDSHNITLCKVTIKEYLENYGHVIPIGYL